MSNTTEAHPVLATRIKQNVKDNDADLLVFDPRKTQIAEYAGQYTQIKAGYDNTWLNGLIRYILKNDLEDREFIEERTTGIEQVEESVEKFTPEFVEEHAGVSPEEIASAAETITEADSCVFGWTLGMTEHAKGTENIYAIANLALVTGHIGNPKSGVSPFRGQNNVQGGGGDMGPLPNNFPGYQPVTNEENREKFAEAYGMDVEEMPDKEGYRLTDMFLTDDIHGMFIQGENSLVSEPNIAHAREFIESLDFFAVQDIFLTETAELADVVLPATASLESNGTYTSSTRHVQLVKRAVDPIGNAKSDWRITKELAAKFGYHWDYEHPSDIMDEINDPGADLRRHHSRASRSARRRRGAPVARLGHGPFGDAVHLRGRVPDQRRAGAHAPCRHRRPLGDAGRRLPAGDDLGARPLSVPHRDDDVPRRRHHVVLR